MTQSRQPRPRQAAAATRRRTRRTEREPKVDDVVEIWWDVDKTYYKGRLTQQHQADMHFTVLYDDGETEDVNLHDEFWKFADEDTVFRSPPPSPGSDPDFVDIELQRRQEASQTQCHAPISQGQTDSCPNQSAQRQDNQKQDILRDTPSNTNSVMKTRRARSESLGRGKPKLKRTKRHVSDKSAIVKRTVRVSGATLLEPRNAAKELHDSLELPRSHVTVPLIDPAPLKNMANPQDVKMTDEDHTMENSDQSRIPSRMKLVKTTDAEARLSDTDPSLVQTVSSGTKRKLSQEPPPLGTSTELQGTGSSANEDDERDSHAAQEQQIAEQQRNIKCETDEVENSETRQSPQIRIMENAPKLPSPTRRKKLRRRIHPIGDDNSTDSSSSPIPRSRKGAPVQTEKAMEITVDDEDCRRRTTHEETRNHSIPIKVSLKRANMRGTTGSRDPNLRNSHITSPNLALKQENTINEIKNGEPEQYDDVDKYDSGSVHRENGEGLSVQTNHASKTDTGVVGSSRKSPSPLGVTNGVQTQSREGQVTKKIAKTPNLDLISPVSGLPELDTCIDTAFGRRLDPIENHLNKLTSEVHQIKVGFDSARHTFEGLVTTKESDIKDVRVDLAALDKKLESMQSHIGVLREDMKTNIADNQSIKRDMAIIISFLRQEAQLRSQREQVSITSAARSSSVPEPRSAPPRQNGPLTVAAHPQPRVPSHANVHHYAAPVAHHAVRNVEYQQRKTTPVEVTHGARQRSSAFQVQRAPIMVQNARRIPVQSTQVPTQGTPVPSQGNLVQVQRSHVPRQIVPAVALREQQSGIRPVAYSASYAENRNRAEIFTYEVMDLVARQVTVWLLETPHEHHKSGMNLDTWAKRTSSTTYARIAPRLAMFRSYEHAKSTLALSLSNGVVDLTWFMSPHETQCTERARRNYDAWDPPPNDIEWRAEMRLLKELAYGFHRTIQNYSHPESTVLEVSVLLTRRAARDYEEAGYRPILTLTNDAQRQQEVYNGQPRGTPMRVWRPGN
eukprot:TRINITY_DN110_c0_g1_i1.p1 TRINITY_DN110_c0_g1~~TRINITY_DN110_c0_g1_i1.p1  ORF type:complete len:1014 (+),score=134.91 TRINITY_DN110_c0_g1_i1:12611-15652(+)